MDLRKLHITSIAVLHDPTLHHSSFSVHLYRRFSVIQHTKYGDAVVGCWASETAMEVICNFLRSISMGKKLAINIFELLLVPEQVIAEYVFSPL